MVAAGIVTGGALLYLGRDKDGEEDDDDDDEYGHRRVSSYASIRAQAAPISMLGRSHDDDDHDRDDHDDDHDDDHSESDDNDDGYYIAGGAVLALTGGYMLSRFMNFSAVPVMDYEESSGTTLYGLSFLPSANHRLQFHTDHRGKTVGLRYEFRFGGAQPGEISALQVDRQRATYRRYEYRPLNPAGLLRNRLP